MVIRVMIMVGFRNDEHIGCYTDRLDLEYKGKMHRDKSMALHFDTSHSEASQ